MSVTDLAQASMHDLFRAEAENQIQMLTSGLLALERNPAAADHLEACMRAAHSLKGAARIAGIATAVRLAHIIEDCFVAAQGCLIRLDQTKIDLLLSGVDLLSSLAGRSGPDHPEAVQSAVDRFDTELSRMLRDNRSEREAEQQRSGVSASGPMPGPNSRTERENRDRLLRVSSENLDRLLGLAGTALVESRRLKPFCHALLRLKRLHNATANAVENLQETIAQHTPDARAGIAATQTRRLVLECQQFLAARLTEIEASEHLTTSLVHRLYEEALACRMRPFGDGVRSYPRTVRDLSRSLGKQVKFDIDGAATEVDRDILDRLDPALCHLLRNALDHGIETPEERRAVGKPPEGTIRLEAHHCAGALQIAVSDDGRGIDQEQLRKAVIERRLAAAPAAERMSETELFEFLFLPGFSTRKEVTEISGRGVGLDVVREMVRKVRGVVRISSQVGIGTRFRLQLPLALSVIRALLADIGGEPYAFPLAHIFRVAKLPPDKVKVLRGRQYFQLDGEQVGLFGGTQLFGCGEPRRACAELPVIVVGDRQNRYGLVVDRLLEERELAVQPLDPRLGKVANISSAALMEDGSPTLIVDVEEMARSIAKFAQSPGSIKVQPDLRGVGQQRRKAVLVIDDSLTVRELERKLLDLHGYRSEVAVDGMDGWNALSRGRFDLVVTDVDMPRMDGIELVHRIRRDPRLKTLPVMILSYKDREEDRRRGLEAGADYYLTKGSFQDDGWIAAVRDLIGGPAA